MSDVVKKGVLDVKKRNLFVSAYKQKFVVLRNSAVQRCKTVEILDCEDSDETEVIKLNSVWTVQDRLCKGKGRYAFELVMGEEAVLTFSCTSVVEREEWTEAFRVLNQLAQPCGTPQQVALPITDYFSVTLVKNRSALEIGHSGAYLLSIQDSAIILHWRTGAIAHHWPRKSVVKLNMEKEREGKLVLVVNRISGSGPQMEFEFTTDHNTAIQVLKQWNIKLLESIPSTCSDKLNEISSFLNQPSSPSSSKIDRLKSREKQSWSFRRPKRPSVKDERLMRRTGSFSVDTTLSVRGTSTSMPHSIRESLTQSFESSNPSGVLSQESFFTTHVGPNGTMSTFGPPLPPRPAETSSDEDDPDYAYIDENKVKGPDRRNSECGSPTVDAELEDIEHSIMMEKKKKRRAAVAESKRTMTLDRYPVHRRSPRTTSQLTFASADPEDYLEPVPSKRLQQSGSPPQDRSPVEVSPTRGEGDRSNPPLLPPRTWRVGSTTSNLSTSSVTSTSSTGGVSASVVSRVSVSSVPETSSDDQPAKVHNVIPEEPTTSAMSTQSPKQLDEPNPAQHSQSPPSTSPDLPPPLPPRSPIKDRHSHQSSSSSISSTSSSTRCPHCRNKKTKSSLGKTFSLTNHVIHPSSHHEELAAKSSLPPDLNKTLPVPENSLCHNQHNRCSHDSSKDVLPSESIPSIPSSEYLTLVGDNSGTADEPMSPIAAVETELQSQLEVITNCVQTLEYLETKVSRENGKSKSASQISQEKSTIQTDLDAAMRQTQQVQADLMVPLKPLTDKPLHNGHAACKRVSGTKGPPPSEQLNTHIPPTSSNGSLTQQQQPHWTNPLSGLNSPPPIPPRSHVSLGQPQKKALRRQKSSPKQIMSRADSTSQSHSVKTMSKSSSLGSNSSLRSYYGMHPQWLNHTAPQSSTVFVHHLVDKRLNHLV